MSFAELCYIVGFLLMMLATLAGGVFILAGDGAGLAIVVGVASAAWFLAAIAWQLGVLVRSERRAKWLGNMVKENQIRYSIGDALKGQEELVEQTFEIVKNQPEYRR